MFQTASLYSIEVDYYHFGTCEMSGGSYFCGDHSCNTFKYVGDKVHGQGGKTLYEQPAIGQEQRFATYNPVTDTETQMGGYPYAPVGGVMPGTKATHGLYTSGTGYLNGNRLPGDASAIANMGLTHTQSVQTDPHGYPLRGDASGPSYHLYDGYKVTSSALEAALVAATGSTIGTGPAGVTMVSQHMERTLVAGKCKDLCDHDVSCRAFQENRWEFLHTTIKCVTIHIGPWVSETSLLDGCSDGGDNACTNLARTDGWDFYEKYALSKTPTWLHAPTSYAFSPTTSGAGDPKWTGFQGAGRRLDGVY